MKISFNGIDDLVDLLEDAANLSGVKRVVKNHGAKLQRTMQRKAVFKGHWKGSGKNRKFVKPTGNLKRSVSAPELTDGGLAAKITVEADYSGYVELGTRYMEAQPYAKPAISEVEPGFISDIERVVIKK